MKNLTLKQINNWFNTNNFEPRHNLKAVKLSINKLNKEVKINAYDLFLLVFENKEIQGLYTHSYGFHTSNGRYLINTFKSYYNQFNQK